MEINSHKNNKRKNINQKYMDLKYFKNKGQNLKINKNIKKN